MAKARGATSFIFFVCFILHANGQAYLRLIVGQTAPAEREIAKMLVEETAARASRSWEVAPSLSAKPEAGTQVVVLTKRSAVERALPRELRSGWKRAAAGVRGSEAPEGYMIVPLVWDGVRVLIIAGNDTRGEFFGTGWLLRHLEFRNGGVRLPETEAFFTAPEKPVRGYQIGYRMKNNTYDAWTLAQFEQQLRDLAVFGMNTVQVIAPVSDDDPVSPLFPATPMQTITGLSRMSAKYDLRFDLYYPELRKDYSRRETMAEELEAFEGLVKELPRVDSLHVPGGDPGHTPPAELFNVVERETEILHRYHPGAEVWVSAQGFDRKKYEAFYELLEQKPAWLTGVFFGPQSRDSMSTQRQKIPKQYRLEFYPDTAHTMHAQFPVPQWDPIFALTEGREPICPRPEDFGAIYRHFADLHSGFMVYSEGVNDDVNKVLWAQWGWSSSTPARQILEEYARYLLHTGGAEKTNRVAGLIGGLEQNWKGPLASNAGIQRNLEAFDTVMPKVRANWRWKSLEYRAVYDAYVQVRRRREAQAEADALALLREAGTSTVLAAKVRETLSRSAGGAEERRLHDRLYAIADDLFHAIGMQLSVKLYGASNWERGANLDRADTPLNDASWMNAQMAAALKKNSEEERLAGLRAIARWKNPVPGSSYDDLGDPAAEPHLVRGKGWAQDPEMYESAIDGIADETLEKGWRLSWLTYAESLYETPLKMHYEKLERDRRYRLQVTYAGEGYTLPMKLLANGTTELQGFRLRKSNPETVSYDLPAALTDGGTLDLQWDRPGGVGGGGRGGQVAEVWLLPVP